MIENVKFSVNLGELQEKLVLLKGFVTDSVTNLERNGVFNLAEGTIEGTNYITTAKLKLDSLKLKDIDESTLEGFEFQVGLDLMVNYLSTFNDRDLEVECEYKNSTLKTKIVEQLEFAEDEYKPQVNINNWATQEVPRVHADFFTGFECLDGTQAVEADLSLLVKYIKALKPILVNKGLDRLDGIVNISEDYVYVLGAANSVFLSATNIASELKGFYLNYACVSALELLDTTASVKVVKDLEAKYLYVEAAGIKVKMMINDKMRSTDMYLSKIKNEHSLVVNRGVITNLLRRIGLTGDDLKISILDGSEIQLSNDKTDLTLPLIRSKNLGTFDFNIYRLVFESGLLNNLSIEGNNVEISFNTSEGTPNGDKVLLICVRVEGSDELQSIMSVQSATKPFVLGK